jgi:23S rRNA pseudouridine1911/1915/1917 synthase
MPETYVIPEGVYRSRADKALAASFPELSRSAWQRALDAGKVTRAGLAIGKKEEVSAGDELELEMPEVVPMDLTPADIPLDILLEDEHLLVINKAAGMVVHPGAGTRGDTLVHALLHHCAGSLSGIGGVERPGIVHRLDRDTTGIIVVAKTDAAHRGLAAQFAERTLKKEYVAVVSGMPRLLSGMIDQPIDRDVRHRHRMTISESGREAQTEWILEEKFAAHRASLLRCLIHTGRTHQIRVHLKFAGHPLLGDRVYGWRPDDRLPIPPERVMLHAEKLKIRHPISQEELQLAAPWPDDFQRMVSALREH